MRKYEAPDRAEPIPVLDPTTLALPRPGGPRLPTNEPPKSTNTYKLLSKKPADLSPFLGEALCKSDKEVLLNLQSRSEALIAAINANNPMAIKASFDAEIAALRAAGNGVKVSKPTFLSLIEREAAGRDKRTIIDAELQELVRASIKPACLIVLTRALELARAQFADMEQTESALWLKYGVTPEQSELWRACRDGVEAIEAAISTKLSGITGEITPRVVLAGYGITL